MEEEQRHRADTGLVSSLLSSSFLLFSLLFSSFLFSSLLFFSVSFLILSLSLSLSLSPSLSLYVSPCRRKKNNEHERIDICTRLLTCERVTPRSEVTTTVCGSLCRDGFCARHLSRDIHLKFHRRIRSCIYSLFSQQLSWKRIPSVALCSSFVFLDSFGLEFVTPSFLQFQCFYFWRSF